MSNRPTVFAGFAPPMPLRRGCLANALAGLTQTSKVGKRQPAKGGPHPAVKQLVALRPSRKRVGAFWLRLGTAALAGAGLALIWQLVDRRSLVRTSLASFGLRLQRRPNCPGENRTSLPPVIRKELREVRS